MCSLLMRSQSGDDGSFRTTRLEGLIDALIEVERPINGERATQALTWRCRRLWAMSGTTKFALLRQPGGRAFAPS
jgi:hypothetical protein